MQELLKYFHENLVIKIIPFADRIPVQLVYIGGLVIGAVLIILWMSLVAMGWIYLERRVAGFIQARYGPNRVHPYVGKDPLFNIVLRPLSWINYILPPGWLQSLADGIKLLSKEDIIPKQANRFLYELAPLLVFAGAFIPFVALPFSQHLVIADMDLGLFYIMAFGALEVVGILMAGWGPNSKWTLYGGMRLAAQMLSYEIPLGLSVLVVVMLSGTLNLTDMVIWQTQGVLFWDDVNTWWIFDFLNWAVFRSPWAAIPAFIIFYVAGLAETKRAPFDLPEAESELVAGFHTEYTGIRFSYFFLAEYCAMYVICVLGAVVFLGGWHWPLPATYQVADANVISNIAAKIGREITFEGLTGWLGALTGLGLAIKLLLWTGPISTISALCEPAAIKMIFNELFGFINLVGKSFVLMFVMLWVRWTLPRVRIDQVMHMCLKVMLPLGLACVVLASFQAVLTSHDSKVGLREAAVSRIEGAAKKSETPATPVEKPAEEKKDSVKSESDAAKPEKADAVEAAKPAEAFKEAGENSEAAK